MHIDQSIALWAHQAYGSRDYVPPSKADVEFVSSLQALPATAKLQEYADHLNAIKSSFGIVDHGFFVGIYRYGLEQGHNIFDEIAKNRFQSSQIQSTIFDNPNDLVSLDLGGGVVGRLMLDINGNGELDTAAELVLIRDLLALDSSRDGLISSDDALFDDMKLLLSDGQIVPLSSLIKQINIQDYVGNYSSDRIDGELGWIDSTDAKTNFLEYIDPVHTYDRFDNDQLRGMLASMPQTDDGWVMRGKDTEEFFKNIAYSKQSANGGFYLQTLPAYNHLYGIEYALVDSWIYTENSAVHSPLTMQALESELISRFDFLYNRYHELNSSEQTDFSKPAEMAFLEKEFERITHMNFSLKNLEKIKTNIAQGKIAESFADLDVVVGIKQDGDNYLLRFNSGRTVSVSSLYFNTGDFLPFDGDKRASLVLPDQLGDGEFSIDETDQLYETLAVKIDDKLTLLKDAGIVAIHKKEFKEKDRIALLFEMADGTTKQHLQLYKITDNKTEIKATSELIREILENPYIEKQSVKKTEIGVV